MRCAKDPSSKGRSLPLPVGSSINLTGLSVMGPTASGTLWSTWGTYTPDIPTPSCFNLALGTSVVKNGMTGHCQARNRLEMPKFQPNYDN
jgi:hypothetical protein